MICIYFSWDNRSLDRELVRRLSAALELGHKLGAQSSALGHAVAGKTIQQRNWRPPRTPRGEVVLFDGYIDNRTELKSLLGEKFQNDDDLYAAAYSTWGTGADLKVIGQFSAIIFHPEEKRVRLARSPLMGPPLHIWNDRERLIVASSPRVIFATGEVSQEIDEQKIADSLILNYCDEQRGWFKDVSRLPVGSHAVATPGDVQIKRYYDLNTLPEIRLSRDDEYVEAANALFKDATRSAIDGFSRPAVSVSGGYDSQAVAAYALCELNGKSLLGLTSVPESGWDGREYKSRFGDESRHVAALAAMYPSLETINIDAQGLYLDHKLNAMFLLANAPPLAASNLYWMHEVWARAKLSGCDVLLTGTMGNASFSFAGEGALPSWFLNGEWGKLLREFMATRGSLYQILGLASQTLMPVLPKRIWYYLTRLRHGDKFDPYQTWCPINPYYAAEMHVEERARDMGHDIYFQPLQSSRALRAAAFNTAPVELCDIMQAFELIHGIPSRDPSAYRPLVEFCFGVPDDQYVRCGERRWLARRMLKGKIPDIVLDEKRRGLQSADWHLRMGRELDAINAEIDRLSEDPAMARRLNLPKLKKALQQWPSETPLGSSLAISLRLAVSRALTTARFINYIEGKNTN